MLSGVTQVRACLLCAVGWLGAFHLLSCDSEIYLGQYLTEDDTDQGLGGQGEDTDSSLPENLLFQSDFEAGDLREWGLSESSLTSEGGVITVQSERAHGGQSAALFSTERTQEHVVLVVDVAERDLLIRFWFRCDALYETYNWPILHMDAKNEDQIIQLWDLGLDSSENAAYRLFLYESVEQSGVDGGRLAKTGTTTLNLAEWTLIEVQLRTGLDDLGAISVSINGEEEMIVSGYPLAVGQAMHLSFGSFASYLEPLPAEFLIDDIEILASP